MVDYVKILFKNIDLLKLKDKLKCTLKVSEDTGEITGQEIKIYFCTIRINKNGVIDFIGSLHKFYNELKGIKAPNYKESNKHCYRGYNGNTFTLSNVLEVQKYLCDLFSCTPQQMKFQNLELGFNLDVFFNPRLFVSSLLFHYGTEFEFKHQRNYAQAGHQTYFIKIYNKSSQYKMLTNVLRVEVKLMKSDEINKLGIETFADINSKTLNKAKDLILKRLDEVVYYDGTIKKESEKERYSNIHYWLNLKPKNRDYHKKKLNKLIVNYSENLRGQINTEIRNKFVIINRVEKGNKFVINNSLKKINKKNKFVINNSFNIEPFIPNKYFQNSKLKTIDFDAEKWGLKNIKKSVQFRQPQQDKKMCDFEYIYNLNTHTKTLCKVTGLSLDLEKDKNAIYIRTKTLRNLQKNEPKIFEMLVLDLVGKSKKRPKWESNIITHLAKQIKNRYYNSYKIKPKRIFKANEKQLELFC